MAPKKAPAHTKKQKAGKPAMVKSERTRTGPPEESGKYAAVLKRLEEMEAKLAIEQEEKQQLEVLIEELRAEKGPEDQSHRDSENLIPRPAGTCGKDWSLQMEMGLASSSKNSEKYKALLRGVRDLVLNANMKWEIGWREIPPGEKSRMFQVARERYPILKRYVNDWATAEMTKQYIKNKRAHHYSNGWLEVPQKYAYLKDNASKRNPTASRVKRAKREMAARKKAKRSEKLTFNKESEVEVDVDKEVDRDFQESGGSESEGESE